MAYTTAGIAGAGVLVAGGAAIGLSIGGGWWGASQLVNWINGERTAARLRNEDGEQVRVQLKHLERSRLVPADNPDGWELHVKHTIGWSAGFSQTDDQLMVLTGPRDAVVYSNNAARQLLLAGRKLEGHRFLRLLEDMPAPFKSAVEAPGDGLFTVDGLQEPETFHLARKRFVLNGQPHRLFLFKQLTRELGRAEVETWKKVIRVIGHELNNSLAPISSLAHSGRQLAQRDRSDKLAELFATVEERSRHLKLFIDGYARFAKLPKPRPAEVEWESFVTDIGNLVAFRLDGELPHSAGWFDPAQVQQVLINLLKNAHESGSEPGEVALDIAESGGGFSVAVLDRGQGMSESVLDNALLPFYSTKRSGSGLGLPLCREVVEAHGGRLRLVNRKDGGLAAMLWLPARPRAAGSSD